MRILEATGITKTFPGVVALDDVGVSFEKGKIHCIIGENGAGKSTLIKILTGVYDYDAGSIFIDGGDVQDNKNLFRKIAYVPQELELFRELTVAENLFMPFNRTGINKNIIFLKELFEKAAPVLEKFQITAKAHQLVSEMSVSEQQLLQIAHATMENNADIIMLDEPTTSLTTKDTERLFKILKNLKEENKSIVFISHKLEEIFAIGDDITVLRNGRMIEKAAVKDVDIPWVIFKMTGQEADLSKNYRSERVTDEILMEVKNLSGEIFDDVSFTLKKGEILGFTGLVGAGRTEIMQTIFGYLPAWNGTVKVNNKNWKLGDTSYSVKNGMFYIPEERKTQGIFKGLSVKENSTITLLGKVKGFVGISIKKEKKLSQDIIKKYQIKTASLSTEIQFLSGGNQQKVIIGRAMTNNPKILIFDEPTKGIDVGTKIEIYKIIKELAEKEQVGIIIISSELEEALKCSNRIICIYNGKKAGEFETDISTKSDILNSIIGISKTS